MFGFALFLANVPLSINQQEGCYDNGRAYPNLIRERVVDLALVSTSQPQIETELQVSRGLVQKVLKKYDEKKTFRYEFPILVLLLQKSPMKSSSLYLLKKL